MKERIIVSIFFVLHTNKMILSNKIRQKEGVLFSIIIIIIIAGATFIRCGCCIYYSYYYYSYYSYYSYYLVLLYVYYYGVSFSRTSFLCLIHALRENCSSSSSNTRKMNVLASAMEKLLATNALRGLYGR